MQTRSSTCMCRSSIENVNTNNKESVRRYSRQRCIEHISLHAERKSVLKKCEIHSRLWTAEIVCVNFPEVLTHFISLQKGESFGLDKKKETCYLFMCSAFFCKQDSFYRAGGIYERRKLGSEKLTPCQLAKSCFWCLRFLKSPLIPAV